ncbi:MAG: hypothetical protein KBT27_12275 [Prevotellaceae bacterium]|nr:hypothetical protein [Candidatus Faecinaster equi]
MKDKQYIAVLGHCPKTSEDLVHILQSIIKTYPSAEINFFDMPCQGSKNSGCWIDHVFVHHYSIGINENEIVRDIIALGPSNVIALDKRDKTILNIVDIVKNYGIEIIWQNN